MCHCYTTHSKTNPQQKEKKKAVSEFTYLSTKEQKGSSENPHGMFISLK